MKDRKPDPIRGALAGLAAGLAASFAMGMAQRLFAAIGPKQASDGDPATVKAANKVSRAAAGRSIEKEHKEAAGGTVHYATGAALGLAYGIAAEYRPEVTAGHGAVFGVATSLALDEAGVPLAGLGKPPWQAPLSSHAFGLASHFVFGLAAEGARRALRHRPAGVHGGDAIG